jgi:TRAP-type C4-dicarboxylate transport system permease small subunit
MKIRIRELIEKGIENITVLLLVVMVLLVFLNATMRYIMGFNIIHSDEVARLSFVWMCLLGCIVTHMRKSHIRVTALAERLPKKAGEVINIIGRIITAGALAYLSHGSAIFVRTSSQFMNPGINVNFGILMSVILIMAAGMLLVDIVDFIKFIVSCIRPAKTVGEGKE